MQAQYVQVQGSRSVQYPPTPAGSGSISKNPITPPPPSFSSLSANMAYSLYHVQMANAWKERVNKEDLRAEQAAAVAAMLEKVRNKHAPQAGRHA